MFEILYDPVKYIEKLKKPSTTRTLLTILATSLLLTTSTVFLVMPAKNTELPLITTAILFSTILLHLIVPLFTTLTHNILGVNATYGKSLTAFTTLTFPISTTTFFASAASQLPTVGTATAIILTTYGTMIGITSYLRTTKELHNTDYSTIAIAHASLAIAIVIAMTI